MKRLVLLLAVIFTAVLVQAQTFPRTTTSAIEIANLPTAAAAYTASGRTPWFIRDGLTETDCTVGGGVFVVQCSSDGIVWGISGGGGGGGGGTITVPTFFTSGQPSYDYVCVDNVTTDTAGLQAAITAASIAGAGLGKGPGGPVNLIGTGVDCQIDGTGISFEGYRHSSPLIVQFKGRTVLQVAGFRLGTTDLISNVKFIGVRGGDALTSFGDQNAEITASGSPNFSAFLIKGGTAIEISGLVIRGFGTEPIVQLTTFDAISANCGSPPCGNTQIRIHDNSIINGASSGVPLYIGATGTGIGGFNISLWGLTLASFSSSYRTLHIKNIGDIQFEGQPQSWLLNGGIELEDTCGGCMGAFTVGNVATEFFTNTDFLTLTGPVGIPSLGAITLRSIYLGDSVGDNYILNGVTTGDGSPIGPVYMYDTAFAAATGIVRPGSAPVRLFLADQVFPEYYKSLEDKAFQRPATGFIAETGLLKAQVDDLRRSGSPSMVRFANIVSYYLPTDFVQTGYGSGTLTTTGIADPWGGTTLAARAVASSAPWGINFYDQNVTPDVGDVWIARLTVKANNANGFTNFAPNLDFTGGGLTDTGYSFNYLSPSAIPVDDDSDWHFIYTIVKVTATDGMMHELLFQAGLNSTALSVDFVAPILVKIPVAAGLSDAEILDYAMKLSTYSNVCTATQLCTINGSIPETSISNTWTGTQTFNAIDALITNAGKPVTFTEGTAPSAVSGKSVVYADSVSHTLKVSNNGGGFQDFLFGTVPVTGGGTGLTTLTAFNLLCANGTSAPSFIPPVMASYVLTDNGPGSCPTFQTAGGSAATALSGITAGGAANTIGSGDFNQRWNWSLTTNGGTAFYFGESGASVATSSYLLRSSTLANSTAKPARFDNDGNGVEMSILGSLGKLGTGGLDWAALLNFPAACTNQFMRQSSLTTSGCASLLNADANFAAGGGLPIAQGGTATVNAPIKRMYFMFGMSNAGVAAPGWSLPAANAMTPASKTDGTNGTIQGILQAADGNIAYATLAPIPDDWASFNSATIVFTTTDITNGHTAIFKIATACTTIGSVDTSAYNAANAFTTVTIGGGAVAGQSYTTTAGTITGTGCAAGRIAHFKFFRDTDTVTDTAIQLTGGMLLEYNGTFQ